MKNMEKTLQVISSLAKSDIDDRLLGEAIREILGSESHEKNSPKPHSSPATAINKAGEYLNEGKSNQSPEFSASASNVSQGKNKIVDVTLANGSRSTVSIHDTYFMKLCEILGGDKQAKLWINHKIKNMDTNEKRSRWIVRQIELMIADQ